MAAVLIELKHIMLLQSPAEWIARWLFCNPEAFSFCLVSFLASLGVDCAVAMGGAILLFCVFVCVNVPVWLEGIAGQLFTS